MSCKSKDRLRMDFFPRAGTLSARPQVFLPRRATRWAFASQNTWGLGPTHDVVPALIFFPEGIDFGLQACYDDAILTQV